VCTSGQTVAELKCYVVVLVHVGGATMAVVGKMSVLGTRRIRV